MADLGIACSSTELKSGTLLPMQFTLKAHIDFLEESIQAYKAQLAETRRANGDRARIASSLHLAELALTYYRKAYELEKSLQSSNSDMDDPASSRSV